jgi:protein TonB
VKVPDVLPDIDLSKKVTDEADFSGKGVAGGSAKGVVGGTAPVSDQPYFEFQVEKQVQQVPGTGNLRYPDMLRSANVEGEVLAQFVVDTTGRFEAGSFKVLKSSHDLFTAAVRSALPNMRFYPAEVGGRKVKQLVQQPFTFSLQKS